MTRGDRIVLRSYSPVTTIAGGVVLDPDAPRGGVRLAPTLQRLRRLLEPLLPSAETSELAVYAVLIAESGRRGLRAADLVWRCGVSPATLPAVRKALVDSGAALDVGDYLVTPEWRPLAAERVRVALAAHHEASPLSDGLPREQVREGVLGGVAPGLVDSVLRELEATGQIVGRDRLALAGRVVSLSAEEAAVTERLESALRTKGLTPPDASQLPALVGSSAPVVDRLLQLLVRQKRVFRLDGLPYHRDALDRLRSEVSALKPAGGEALRGRVQLQEPVWPEPEVRDSPARISRQGARDAPGGGEAVSAVRAEAELKFGPASTLRVLIAVVDPVARRVLEVPDALADAAADFRQAVGAEDQDHDDENDDEFGKAQTTHGITPARDCST